MQDNNRIILQCDLYNVIKLDRGCCGQVLQRCRTKFFWRKWKKKFFQYQNGRLHLWNKSESHKNCKKINIKTTTTITNIIPCTYLMNYTVYKFTIQKGNGKYTFASPRREKISLLWNYLYAHINSERSDIFFPC